MAVRPLFLTLPLAALLGTALLPAPSAATGAVEPRQWIGGEVGLTYGTPFSDDSVIAFNCVEEAEGDAPALAVFLAYEPAFLRDGEAVTLELASEGGSLALQGTGWRMEMDDLFLIEAWTREAEARRELGAALQRLLIRGETLSLLLEDGILELPLAGLAAAVEAGPGPQRLFAGCGG